MKTNFITREQAEKLKLLGFNVECFIGINSVDIFRHKFASSNHGDYVNWDNKYDKDLRVPTFQQAFDWFIDEHNVEGNRKSWTVNNKIVWYVSIEPVGSPSRYKCYDVCVDSKEEANNILIDKLIEYVDKNTKG